MIRAHRARILAVAALQAFALLAPHLHHAEVEDATACGVCEELLEGTPRLVAPCSGPGPCQDPDHHHHGHHEHHTCASCARPAIAALSPLASSAPLAASVRAGTLGAPRTSAPASARHKTTHARAPPRTS